MKRSEALTPLARDHHLALVLARRAQRSAAMSAEDLELLLADLNVAFVQLLEPHFETEEQKLLPVMRTKGEITCVERTLNDHRALRDHMRRIQLGDVDKLVAFGELLATHIRFEDRELFGIAEALLTPSELATLIAD